MSASIDNLVFDDGWSDLTQLRQKPEINVERMYDYRRERLRQQLRLHDADFCLLVNPISLRYAVDYRSYMLFQSHIPTVYLFLPQDTAADGGHWRPSTVVRWTVFQNALQNARGLRLMFVDTCHAGGAYNPRLVKDAHDAEIIVFSATDASTKALELAKLGHGVFTFALTQGLTGGAANHDGAVELFALQSYVARQVENLTHGTQAPAIHLSGVKNFVIARKG